MSKQLLKFKKALLCLLALATSASMLTPVSALAAEIKPEVNVVNHTEGRSDAKTVSGITISDVTAPKEGQKLDDKAVVTTAEKETWEIPVIWIGEDLKPDAGLAGKGSYLPVLAFVVPDNYTVKSDSADGKGYTITLSEDLLKLFGESEIISIYEMKSGITYILPAGLKDLFAEKKKTVNPKDEAGNEIIPSDQVAPYAEDENAEEEAEEEEEEEEKKEDEETYSHLVNVHCDDKAKKALSKDDLEFLADLVVNKLHPQAVNLLQEKFPAFKEAADNGKIGDYLAVLVSYDDKSDVSGYASRGWTDDMTYPDYRFCYSFTVNAAMVSEYDQDNNPVVVRDTSSSKLTELANTIVHELFHVFSYDYNRPGLTGRSYVDGTLSDVDTDVQFPVWFVEGTATSVEDNWFERQDALKMLRTPSGESTPLENYDKDLLLNRYVNGRYYKDEDGNIKCDYNFDIQCCNGTDLDGRDCEVVSNRYISGYLATMYLCELAVRNNRLGPGYSGSSIVENEDGTKKIDSTALRKGLNYIIESMHNGQTLDGVINNISRGSFVNTYDFEERFIKGIKDGEDVYQGEADSLNFVYEFVTYMNELDKEAGTTRNNLTNGSLLFDFDKDFRSPLDFGKEEETNVLKALDNDEEEIIYFSRSTVKDSEASSTGGRSKSGSNNASSGSSSGSSNAVADSDLDADNVNSNTQDAAKETGNADTADAAETDNMNAEETRADDPESGTSVTEDAAPADTAPAEAAPAAEPVSNADDAYVPSEVSESPEDSEGSDDPAEDPIQE